MSRYSNIKIKVRKQLYYKLYKELSRLRLCALPVVLGGSTLVVGGLLLEGVGGRLVALVETDAQFVARSHRVNLLLKLKRTDVNKRF